jgi:hypothetical protein
MPDQAHKNENWRGYYGAQQSNPLLARSPKCSERSLRLIFGLFGRLWFSEFLFRLLRG